jgi:molybdenum cofactor cytidylyltransferase
MIRKTAEQICKAELGPAVLVTGRDADEIAQAIDGLDITITHNPDFATGMASSLRAGLNALPDGTEGALVCLGDMPLVTAANLAAIAAQFDPVEGRSICVPTHDGKWGNPILWGEAWFDEMRAITGDKGARALLHEYADRVHEVPLETDAILQDFDTPDSLAGR